MAIDHKALKQALKTLDSAPKEITRAKERYSQQLAEIRKREASGDAAPNQIKQAREKAKAERDRVVKALAESMFPALETVRANNDYTAADLDLDDKKLQTALTIINSQGKNLSHALQVKLLAQFRGDPAALSVLEGAYKKNGLYFAGMAKEMQRPIGSQALEEMETALAYYSYYASQGIYDFDEKKVFWTRNAYADQAQRLGYDLDGEPDPYEYALSEMRRKIEEETFSDDPVARATVLARQWAVESAAREIANAKQSGKDEAGIFNEAIVRLQRLSEKADATAAQE